MRVKSLVMGGIAACALVAGVLPLSASAATQTDDPDTLIVGGHEATEQYDWMASLQRDGNHSCGASLIDPEWVLTAAHCVQDVQPSGLNLRIGSPDHTTGGTEAGVSEIKVHPDYATSNDIALLKLDAPVANTPIPLADASGEPGTASRIIGWGLTCPVRGCGEAPAQLQELETNVAPDVACTLGFIDAPGEICTGSQQLGSNACFGDSGGPQLEGEPGNWRLTGVTSRLGSPVPVCGTAPSIYTDATTHLDWINQTIGA